MKTPVYSRILLYALYLAFVGGAVIALTLPWGLDFYARIFRGAAALVPAYRAFIQPFLMAVAVPGLWILVEMICMLRSINGAAGPFVARNVRALYRIGGLLFLLAAAFLFKCFFFMTFLTLLGMLFFIGSGLFAFTFAALIRQSIVFREENDLTI
ncbi:MAG: DUF2975 domain-containing protein [Defluviitaleaceae bacterium]|nr:DUF2975 domain-containing protein [Defluviitaleaceae bacterium]